MEEKYDFLGLIKQIEEYISNTEFNSNDMLRINRVIYKLRNIYSITDGIDEDLYSSIIESDYINLKNYCTYFTSGQHTYLNNMQTTTNNIVNNLLRYIDFSMLLGNKVGIKKNIRNYKYEITKQNNLVETETSQFLENIKSKTNNLENQNSELNQALNNFNIKLEELEKKNNELNNDVEALIKQSNEKIDALMEKEKARLDDNYNKEITSYKNKFDEIINTYDERFKAQEKEYSIKYETLYNEINEKDNQISKLLGIVGDKARIGEYKKNADLARKERIIWQTTTIILFFIAFGIMVYVTLNTEDYNKFTLFKYIVSAILMGAATYTGKQASNSRKDEVYYRKQELELASIDVYLDNMNPSNKDEIKKELSSKIFGQAHNTYTNKNDEKKGFSVEEIIKLLETLKNQK